VQAKGPALRGGAWNNNERNARLSERNNDHPNNEWNNNGFRVLALHRFAIAGSATWSRPGVEAKLAGLIPGRGFLLDFPAKNKKAPPVPVAKEWRPSRRGSFLSP